MPKKVLVLTGKRGGYGAMRNMLTLLRDDPYFDLYLVATDMHLRHEFGYTVDEIHKDFPDTHTITLNDTGRAPASRAWALGELQSSLVTLYEVQRPNCVVLFGDRGESLVAATAALHMNIPIAHIQGGDISGGIDNSIRNAISWMAEYHFVSCTQSRHVLERGIPETSHIYQVGDLHIDLIKDRKHEPEDGPGIIIVIYHPETGPGAFDPGKGIAEVLTAVFQIDTQVAGKKIVCIYPCSDSGYRRIATVLEQLPTGGNASVHRNMEQEDFHNLLARAELIVGNSSCGIIEAPYFRLPAVNVGRRQSGRLRCGNVLEAATNSEDIQHVMRAAMKLRGPFDKPYGDGHAGEKIVKILREVL